MKILLIGDTHGKLDKVRDIYGKLRDIDLIAHTGDHYRDGIQLGKEFNVPVIAVKGNCDGSCSRDDFEIIETEAGKVLLTHGHAYNVNYDLTGLMYKAMEEDCKAVFFGHTHRCMQDEANGIRFINPGSLTQPRDGSGGSYAIVRTSQEGMEASIVYYNTVMGTSSDRKQNSSGFLRNLLNYCDRF
ncbi:MAG: metallophosphoesterase [Clostridiales bacterium]|nr:metallophosphoesterase [Clostridiales bacterium]